MGFNILHALSSSRLIQVCKSDSELSTEQEGRQQDDEIQGQSCPSNVADKRRKSCTST